MRGALSQAVVVVGAQPSKVQYLRGGYWVLTTTNGWVTCVHYQT